MAKLTKAQRKAHSEAKAILTKDRLSDDERDFVLRNWHEGATFINGAAGAFFTPYDLASDFAIDAGSGRVIDLCAGISGLAYHVAQRSAWSDRATTELRPSLHASRSIRDMSMSAASFSPNPVGSMPTCSTGGRSISAASMRPSATRPRIAVKHVSTHIEDALADRFAALAKAHGGKSALLRRLVTMAVDGTSSAPTPIPPAAEGAVSHLSVRLSQSKVEAVRKAAGARGMKPAQWLRSMVRVRLGGGTQYSANELHQLRALAVQVRKVGVNAERRLAWSATASIRVSGQRPGLERSRAPTATFDRRRQGKGKRNRAIT